MDGLKPIENYFIKYLNNSFRKDRFYLKNIVCELNEIIKIINSEYYERHGFTGLLSLIPDYKKDWDNIILNYDNILKANYERLNRPCLCILNSPKGNILNVLCKRNKQKKCYECDQLIFTEIVSKIIAGKPYEKISGFDFIQSLANTHIKHKREFTVTNDIQVTEMVLLSELSIPSEVKLYKIDEFRKNLLAIISYSLLSFLAFNDSKKIKKCNQCNQFFISKTNRESKYCSDDCRLKFHNTKRIKSGEAKEYKRKKRAEGYY